MRLGTATFVWSPVWGMPDPPPGGQDHRRVARVRSVVDEPYGMQSAQYDAAPVVVVGAGLAGLTAAWSLVDQGRTVLVLEARDRVGGRASTVTEGLVAQQHADLGGELVAEGYAAVTRLCDELGVELSEPVWMGHPDAEGSAAALGYLTPGRIVVGGQVLGKNDLSTVVEEVRTALDATPPSSHETIEQWARRSRLSDAARSAIRGFARMPTQHDPFQVDAHYLTDGHVGEIRRVLGGTQRLAEALAGRLTVQLESPVRVVRQSGGVVVVELESGDLIPAEHVVVALPPFVTPTIGFDPPLPAVLVNTLVGMQRASGGKVVGQYAEGDRIRQALTHAVFSDGPINTAWVGNPSVTEGPAVVSGFVCGESRWLLGDPEHAAAELDRLVSAVLGEPVTRLAQHVKDWSADLLTGGIIGTPPFVDRGEQVAILATPERRVHFAGDHTDTSFCGTLEGAVRSGLRAAAEILGSPRRIPVAQINDEMVRR